MKHRYDKPIIENLLFSENRDTPFVGMRIKPEAPYSRYEVGYINLDKKSERMYVKLYLTHNDTMNVSYSRYLFQIDYWKKYQQWIPDGYEVDHVDGNFQNDSLRNLQLLTKEQNIFKGAIMRGCLDTVLLCPVCQNIFFRIPSRSINDDDVWNPSCCSVDCCHKLHLTNLSTSILEHVKKHQYLYTIRKHWFEYEDFLLNYYPYTEILEFGSRELFSNGKKCNDIPGLTEFCWAYITPIKEQINVIREMLTSGMTYLSIREKLNIGEKRFNKFLLQFLPEFTKKNKYENWNAIIMKFLDKKYTIPEISKETGICMNYIYQFVKNERPELIRKTVTQNTLRSLIPKIKDALDSRIPVLEIAKMLNIKCNLVMDIMKNYIYN